MLRFRLASAFFATAISASAASPATGFLPRTISVAGSSYRYVVYVPPEWTSARTWPVILFLHGSEEIGTDGVRQSYVGLARALRNHPDRFPAIVVLPQCQPGYAWKSPAMEAFSLAALDAATQEFNGDRQRTYLTGFSMGGYGSWDLAARYPDRFAALVIVCGGIVWPPQAARLPVRFTNPYAGTAQAVAHLPIWLFHGDKDRNVPVTESRRMADALRALDGRVTYTEYKGMAHRIWDRAYDDPDLPAWLFAQRQKTAP